SYEVALAKPEPEIYRLTLNRLGVLPGDTLFVDDRPENIEAAAALGIRTLPFTGDGSGDEPRRLRGGERGEASARPRAGVGGRTRGPHQTRSDPTSSLPNSTARHSAQ